MIEIDGVHKAFGDTQVLRGVTLRVDRGQSFVVIGPSGTGKSVLLKCLLGLTKPDKGQIRIDGLPVAGRHRDACLGRTGMLFQGAALFDSLPIWRNVAFRLLHGRNRPALSQARDIAIEKLRRVGLSPDVADLYPSDLSGGMQKRAGLARAIAADPELLYFDEPTTGLDPIMSGIINDLIVDLVNEMGATAITITHDMASVRAIASDVALLHAGTVKWQGPIGALDTSPDPFVQQFITGRADGPISPAG